MKMHHAFFGFALCIALTPIRIQAQTNEPALPAQPKVYALVAAMGTQFSLVSDASLRTGSHLSPYRRRTTDVPNDVLNRIALHSLDSAIAKIDPESRRIYLSLAFTQIQGVAPSEREEAALRGVLAELQKMPQRLEWDRIVIATPAYRPMEYNRLADRLQGN